MILRGTISSDSLHVHTSISVFAPDAPPEAGAYRVVYLLHGLHGNNGTWLDNTMLPVFAKDSGALFVMPEVGRSFYTDMKYGYDYFTFVSEELPQITARHFNISKKREDTAVMGCSMGGYGALKCALSKPERYGFCGAISTAGLYLHRHFAELRRDPTPMVETFPQGRELIKDFYSVYGDNLEERPENNLLTLAQKAAAGKIKPKIYAACGSDDDLAKDNNEFSPKIKELGFDYTYEEWTGGHDWYFFNDALKKCLEHWPG